MNDTIRLLNTHRSIRRYTADLISEEQLHTIIHAAQMASTSSNMQAYSVIRVRDEQLRQQISVLADNQAYVAECPLFLVWCADLNRLQITCEMHDAGYLQSTVENFIVATVDTALAAQNAAVAAESMGLGVVYIGGVRNGIQQISQLLHLPRSVYPVFGMCIGVPDQSPIIRPRLPVEAILHEDRYDANTQQAAIEEYDRIYNDYFLQRTAGKRGSVWSMEMARKVTQPLRAHMKQFLIDQGFELT